MKISFILVLLFQMCAFAASKAPMKTTPEASCVAGIIHATKNLGSKVEISHQVQTVNLTLREPGIYTGTVTDPSGFTMGLLVTSGYGGRMTLAQSLAVYDAKAGTSATRKGCGPHFCGPEYDTRGFYNDIPGDDITTISYDLLNKHFPGAFTNIYSAFLLVDKVVANKLLKFGFEGHDRWNLVADQNELPAFGAAVSKAIDSGLITEGEVVGSYLYACSATF